MFASVPVDSVGIAVDVAKLPAAMFPNATGPALEIIKRAKIPTYVLNGKRLDQLEKAIANQTFDGTIIKN